MVWTDNSDNEETFEIERRESGAGFILIGVVGANATQFVDRDLAQGVEYAYRVRAVNLVGNSGYSNEATGTAASPPAAPSEVRQIAGGETSLTVGWNDNSDDESAFRVRIFVKTMLPSGFEVMSLVRTIVVGPNETSASITELEPSSIGTASVQAIRGDLASESADGEIATLIGLKALEVLPRDLTPGRIARLRVLLSAPAARGGVAVTLSHEGPKQLRLPARVRVRAGSMGAEVPVSLGAVKESSFVLITAEVGESHAETALFVRPRGR